MPLHRFHYTPSNFLYSDENKFNHPIVNPRWHKLGRHSGNIGRHEQSDCPHLFCLPKICHRKKLMRVEKREKCPFNPAFGASRELSPCPSVELRLSARPRVGLGKVVGRPPGIRLVLWRLPEHPRPEGASCGHPWNLL